MKVCMLRFVNQQVSSAMSSWTNFVKGEQQKERLAQQVLFRMGNSLLWSCFSSWSKAVAFLRRDEQALCNRRLLMSRVMSKMSHCHLASGWRAWVLFVETVHRQQIFLKRICGRITKGQIFKGFNQWAEIYRMHRKDEAQRERLRRQLQRLISKMKATKVKQHFHFCSPSRARELEPMDMVLSCLVLVLSCLVLSCRVLFCDSLVL
jgi:hypothetical protein